MKYMLTLVLAFGSTSFSLAQDKDEEMVYLQPEKHAEFKGGPAGWTKFLSSKLRYPSLATKMGVEGPVFVSFIINKKGKVIDPVVIRSPHESLSKEAVRVLKLSPKWKPAKHEGKIVKSRVQVQIQFKLPKG